MVAAVGIVALGFAVVLAVVVVAGALLVVAGFCVVVVALVGLAVVVLVVSDAVVVVVVVDGDVSRLPVASFALSVVVVVSEVVVVVVCSATETSSEDLTSFPQAVSESAARQTEITTAKSFFFTLFPLFDFVLIETVYHILHKKSTENCTK